MRSDDDLPSQRSKRRRPDTLEHGFAHLSLNHNHPYGAANTTPTLQPVFVDPNIVPMDTDPEPAMDTAERPLAYIVEEPPVPEINMKTSSWYELEPDRQWTAILVATGANKGAGIVITDLDSFNESDDEGEQDASHVVNPALLERLRSKQRGHHLESPPATSQALVLFRPLPYIQPVIEEVEDEDEPKDNNRRDEEAMEIEA